MNPHNIDDPIDPIEALRAELQRVPPPAGYVARLRQRIDAEGDVPVRSVWWRWAFPMVAVAVVLLAIAVNRPAPPVPIASTAQVEEPRVAPVLQPSPAPPTVAPAVARVPPVAHRAANTPLPNAEPMPEIITNQADVLRAMWARSTRKTTLVESTDVIPDPAAEIVVAPIEISPIVIKPLTGGGATGNLPIVRPPDRNSPEGRAK